MSTASYIPKMNNFCFDPREVDVENNKGEIMYVVNPKCLTLETVEVDPVPLIT